VRLRGSGSLLAALVSSVALVLLAQTALLRTHGAMPAAPLFVLGCAVGGWAAARAMPRRSLEFGAFRSVPVRRDWYLILTLAVALNAGCLLLFGRSLQPNLAWTLYAASIVTICLGFWLLDGRLGLQVNWREEHPWLLALGVLLVAGTVLRLIWLDHVPAGLWFDEAADTGLEVRRMLADPHYRPVFALQPELWRYPALWAFRFLGPTVFAIRLPHALAGIAGIGAIYFAGRELYGRRAGLIAAAILTTLVWHLTFSRIAFSAVMSVTLDALALFCLVRAVKTRIWLAAALCGACIGLGVQVYYTSRFMAAVLLVLLGMMWIRRPRASAKAVLQLGASAVLAALVCASPLIEFAIAHPTQFNARVSTLSVFNEVGATHSLAPLENNLRAHLLMFNLAGDRNGRHNLPGQPELNFLLAGLFVLGLAMSLGQAKRPEFLILPVWFLAMLAGGVLSVAFEAPQSLRTFDEVNVVALACALPLALAWRHLPAVFSSRPSMGQRAARTLAVVPVLAFVGLSGYVDVDRYFQKQQRDPAVFSDSSGAATLLAQEAVQLPATTTIYMSEELVGQPTITFLAPNIKQTPFNLSVLPLTTSADTAMFLLGEEAPAVGLIRQFYPGAAIKPLTAPYGGPVLLYEARLAASTVGALHGVTATYQAAGGQTVQRREQGLDFSWNPPPLQFPFEASWSSVIDAPAFGDYRFLLKAPAGARLAIDGQRLSATAQAAQMQLAQGVHDMALSASIASPRDAVDLLWQPPQAGALEPVPADRLFTAPVAVHGLLGSYFKNDGWYGRPELRRVDPQVAFKFHLLPLPPPFSIEWTGTLAAPAAGLYRVGTNAIDSSELWIDGRLVLQNQAANQYREATLDLSPGSHAIRLRYEGHTGNFHVELYWQPPGGERAVVPASALRPAS
jgi:hypothetical protein